MVPSTPFLVCTVFGFLEVGGSVYGMSKLVVSPYLSCSRAYPCLSIRVKVIDNDMAGTIYDRCDTWVVPTQYTEVLCVPLIKVHFF
jgi:hypothetical protein